MRDATRDRHQHLEAALQVASCLADRVAYRRLLGGFLGLHETLEARLAECRDLEKETGYRMGERSKVAALRRDLKALGMTDAEIDALPRFAARPIGSCAAALGVAYVLEGSTLGGQSITRMIGEKSPGLPAEFFNVYGGQTRERWRSFLECVAALPLTEDNLRAATEAARQTFDDFARWLT